MTQCCTNHPHLRYPHHSHHLHHNNNKKALYAAGDVFEVIVDLPPSSSDVTATIKFESVLPVPSKVVQVRYTLPFGLDVVPSKGLAVCTANGAGGEKVGDVLRYTSYWKLGLPVGGNALADSAAAFSGGLSWQCSMYDVMSAKNWEQVVEALVSNTDTRTDEVLLIFERPLLEEQEEASSS